MTKNACTSCGAEIAFAEGATSHTCEYCGAVNINPLTAIASAQNQADAGLGQAGNKKAPFDRIVPFALDQAQIDALVYVHMRSIPNALDDIVETATITARENFYVPVYVSKIEAGTVRYAGSMLNDLPDDIVELAEASASSEEALAYDAALTKDYTVESVAEDEELDDDDLRPGAGVATCLVPISRVAFEYDGEEYDVWISCDEDPEIYADVLPIDNKMKQARGAAFIPGLVALVFMVLVAFNGGHFSGIGGLAILLLLVFGWLKYKAFAAYEESFTDALETHLDGILSGATESSSEQCTALVKAFKAPERPMLARYKRDILWLPLLVIVALLLIIGGSARVKAKLERESGDETSSAQVVTKLAGNIASATSRRIG